MFHDASFTLLIGSDVVKTFDYRWDDLGTLLRTVSLAIGMRDGDTTNDIIAIIDSLQKQYNLEINYTLINTSHSHVASSRIRNKSTH
jgi:nicotinic acid mononucleotide adenylyltransferase